MITPYALWWRACKKETIFPANEPVNRGGGECHFFAFLMRPKGKVNVALNVAVATEIQTEIGFAL